MTIFTVAIFKTGTVVERTSLVIDCIFAHISRRCLFTHAHAETPKEALASVLFFMLAEFTKGRRGWADIPNADEWKNVFHLTAATDLAVNHLRKSMISLALDMHAGNTVKASQFLGIDRSNLLSYRKRYGLMNEEER